MLWNISHGITNSYRQEIPTRFAKEIVKAVDMDKDGVVTGKEIEQLLKNIDTGHKMNKEEINGVLKELGASDPTKGIAVNQVMEVFQNTMQNPVSN